MSYGAPAAFARPMIEILDEAIETLRQDLAEYGYIGLIGGIAAAIAVIAPGVTGSPAGHATGAVLLTVAAVMTMGTASAAFAMVASGMHPESSAAFKSALLHFVTLIRPWLLLIVALWTGVFAVGTFYEYYDIVPVEALTGAFVACAVIYAFPRSLYAPAVFEHELRPRDAARASSEMVRFAAPRVRLVWLITCAPAMAISLLMLWAGFDVVAGAIIAFFFVASTPFAAAVMSLLFTETASLVVDAAEEQAPLARRAHARG